MPWVNARGSHLSLSVCKIMAMKVGDGIVEESGPDGYNQVMFTQDVETTEAFLPHGAGASGKGLHWRMY